MDTIIMCNDKGVANEPRELSHYSAVPLRSTELYRVFSAQCYSVCNFTVLVHSQCSHTVVFG